MPHKYPGVDIPLRHFPQEYGKEGKTFFPMGAHSSCIGAESPLLPVREVAMMILMDRLSDKPGWHEKVFDEAIVAKWGDEALTQPEDGLYETIMLGKSLEELPKLVRCRIMSEAAFDYVCIIILSGFRRCYTPKCFC